MKYKGVIFDLDGVICSTDEYHYQAWREMADSIGVDFDRTINGRLKGVSRMESLDIILEKSGKSYSDWEKNELADKKNNIYREFLKSMTKEDLAVEVRDSLQELRKEGKLLAIGSSSKNAKLILDKIGLRDFFDAVSDGTNINRSKPDPEVFLKAAKMLGLTPGECLVVEDAKAGIDAAEVGGFDSAGLSDASEYDKTTYPLKCFNDILAIDRRIKDK